MVEEESQKVTPLVAPPDKEAAESAEQIKLPEESVVSLPPLDKSPQLYAAILTAEFKVVDPPIPTLPEVFKVLNWELPATLREERRLTPEVTESEPPIPTLPVELRVETPV
jgi:hypothetical protein